MDLTTKQVQKFKETEIGKTPADWEVEKLQDHLIIKGRIGWKGLKTSEYTDSGPFIVGGLQIIDNKVEWDKCPHVTEERYNESPEIMLQESDILMTKDGTIGKLAFIENITHKATVASHIHVIRKNSDRVMPLFLFYFFKSRRFQNLIQSKTTGSVVPALTQKDINNTLFPIPLINEQKNISEFLYTLYKKIENLQNQNKILESIAQTVFKSWFVDYDGVTEFEDSELGKIPKGWSIDKLENHLELTKGVSYKSKELVPSNKALVTLKSVNRGGGYAERGFKSFNGRYKDSQIVYENNIIIAQTDLTQDAAVIGKPALVRNSKEFDVLIASLDLLIARPKDNEDLKLYFYYMFLTNKFQSHIYGYTNGTGVLHLAKDGVPSYQFLIPPKGILKKFDRFVSSIIKKNHNNHYQIGSLTQTRDALLTKLMSGEIRI